MNITGYNEREKKEVDMGETKKKIEDKVEQKRKVTTQIQAKTPQGLSSVDALVTAWMEEIRDLQGKKYTSIEEAVDTVVNKVVLRLKLPAHEQKEVREFLALLFENDPSLKEELLKGVKVG